MLTFLRLCFKISYIVVAFGSILNSHEYQSMNFKTSIASQFQISNYRAPPDVLRKVSILSGIDFVEI